MPKKNQQGSASNHNNNSQAKSMDDARFIKRYAEAVAEEIGNFRKTHSNGNESIMDLATSMEYLKQVSKRLQKVIIEIHGELNIPASQYTVVANEKDADKLTYLAQFDANKWSTDVNVWSILNEHEGREPNSKKIWKEMITFDKHSKIMESPYYMETFVRKLYRLGATLYHEATHTVQAWHIILYAIHQKFLLKDQLFALVNDPSLKNSVIEGDVAAIFQLMDRAERLVFASTKDLHTNLFGSLVLLREVIRTQPVEIVTKAMDAFDIARKGNNFDLNNFILPQAEEWFNYTSTLSPDPGYLNRPVEIDAFEKEKIILEEVNRITESNTFKQKYPPITVHRSHPPADLESPLAKILLATLALKNGGEGQLNQFIKNTDELRAIYDIIAAEKSATKIVSIPNEGPSRKFRKVSSIFSKDVSKKFLENFSGYKNTLAVLDTKIRSTLSQKNINFFISSSNESYNLSNIFSAITKYSNNSFVLGNERHLLLVVKNETGYFFYDHAANFSLFTESLRSDDFQKTLVEHLNHPERSQDYGITKYLSKEKFKLTLLDSSLFEDVALDLNGTHITAAELATSNILQRQLLAPTRQNGIGDGLCFETTVAKLYAISKGGLKSLDQIDKNLQQIASTTDPVISNLKKVRPILHDYLNTYYPLNYQNLKTSKTDLLNILERTTTSTQYKLGSSIHAMSVGVEVGGEIRTYYVIDSADPNAIPGRPTIQATSISDFASEFDKYFTRDRLIKYKLNPDNPLFEVIKMDIALIANIPIEIERKVYFSMEQYATSTDLYQSIAKSRAQKEDNHNFLEKQLNELEITDYALKQIEGESLAKRLEGSMATLINNSNGKLTNDHRIVLSLIKKNLDGKYELSFYHKTTGEIETITTSDSTYAKVKEYLSPTNSLERQQTPNSNNKGPAQRGITFPVPMSYYFILQALLSRILSRSENQPEVLTPTTQNLIASLQIHGTLMYGNLISGGILDTASIYHYLRAKGIYTFVGQKAKNFYHTASISYDFLKPGSTQFQALEKALPKILPGVFSAPSTKVPGEGSIRFLKALSRFDAAMNSISVIMSGVNLANAENRNQRIIYGTQLGFDIAGLGLTGLALVTPSLGALGIPLVFTGMAINTLQTFYASIEEIVKTNVTDYFNEVKKAYQEGYDYNPNKKQLTFSKGAVVTSINLETGEIIFDTQRLRIRDSKDPKRVSNQDENKFSIDVKQVLLAGNASKDTIKDIDRNSKHIVLPSTPKSLISYNTVNYQALTEYGDSSIAIGGATGPIRTLEKANTGFKLEQTQSVWIFKNLIYELFHQYQTTTVEVKLGELDRLLEVPNLPRQTSRIKNISSSIRTVGPTFFQGGKTLADLNKENELNNNHELIALATAINYHLGGKGGQYTIALRPGADFKLSNEGEKIATWIFDARLLEQDEIKVAQDRLIIGATTINIDSTATNNRIFVIGKDDQSYSIDLARLSSVSLQVNADQWKNQSKVALCNHIKGYIQQNNLSWMKYIPVINFYADEKNAGRAYYEVEKDQILFTKRVGVPDIKSTNPKISHQTIYEQRFQKGKLAAVVGNDIYFLYKYQPDDPLSTNEPLQDRHTSRIWKVDALTGELKDSYGFHIADENKNKPDNLELWQEGEKIFISRKAKEGEPQVVYQLKDETIEQVSLHKGSIREKENDRLYNLRLLDELREIVPIAYTHAKFIKDEKEQYSSHSGTTLASLFTAYGIDPNTGKWCRYWIRQEDNDALIFIKANLPDTLKESAMRLVLVSNMKSENGEEIFYFYDPDQKDLYRQEGTGTSIAGRRVYQGESNRAFTKGRSYQHYNTSPRIKAQLVNPELINPSDQSKYYAKVVNTFTHDNQLFITSEDGKIYQIDREGKHALRAISEEWIRQQGDNWTEKLNTLSTDSNENVLPVIGLKWLDGQTPLRAWYYLGKLILEPNLSGNNLQLVGVNNNLAYFLDSESGKLYKQEIVNQSTLKSAFGSDHILDFDEILNISPILLFTSERFKSVSVEGELVRLVTKDEGAILLVDESDNLTLIGLDNNKKTNLDYLKNKYSHPEVIPIQNHPGDIYSWYHFGLETPFTSSDLVNYGNPQYLGTHKGSVEQGGGFYFHTDQGIARYMAGKQQAELVTNLTGTSLERLREVLLIKGNGNNMMKPLWLEGVNTLIFQGRPEIDRYDIDLKGEIRSYTQPKRRIIIDNSDLASDNTYGSDSIDVKFQDPAKTQVTRQDNNLLIMNQNEEIVITKIFDEENISHGAAEIWLSFDNNQKTARFWIDELVKTIKQATTTSNGSGHIIYPVFNVQTDGNLYTLHYTLNTDYSLEIKGTQNNEYLNLKSKWVKEATHVILRGDGGEDFYEIDLTNSNKPSSPNITIDNLDVNKAKDYLKILIKEYGKTKLSRKDNDLHIFNEADHIFIKNVFADNKGDYNHLKIELIGQEKTQSFEVDVIVNKWIALDGPNQYLNSRALALPDFERYLTPTSSSEG